MYSFPAKKLAARVGAAALLTAGLVAGLAAVPAGAQPLTAGAATTTYTVMGDSYSASSGGGNESAPCGQSTAGYGNVVAASKGYSLVNIACAGFSTTEVTALQVPQLPGNTKLITLTAGGNDVAWTTAVSTCLQPASTTTACTKAVANSIYLISKVPRNATTMLKAIKAKAPRARILYLGYPRLFEPQNMSALGFTETQISGVKALNGAADLLNATLAYTALSNRVAFVPVAYRFAGHAVPSADPWLNYPPPFGTSPFPFHPNANGYSLGYAAALRPFL